MKNTGLLILSLFILFSFVSYNSGGVHSYYANTNDSTRLAPKPFYGDEIKLITQILDTYHYKNIKLNDSLSSVILDNYIATLDNNRNYFLKHDIEAFEKYRYLIDDYARQGDVTPAYEIFKVYKQRFEERIAYIEDTLLTTGFNFNLKEVYNMDRSKAPWEEDREAYNDLWRKMVKAQALNLKLSNKEPEELNETILKRYQRLHETVNRLGQEEIFELYTNTLAEAFDLHTNYFSPVTSNRFTESMSLSLEGIGARLQVINDMTTIIEIITGGPADKSNLLKENDRIVGAAQGMDGEMVDMIGWRIEDVVKLIKGPKGTVVRLNILSAESGVNGVPKEIVLTREKIKLEDMEAKAEVRTHTQDGKTFKVGIITLPSFYMDFEAYQKGDLNYNSTTRDVKRLVLELKEKGINALMIDLRNNGGGSLTEAINLTGLFIKDGPVVQVRDKANVIHVSEDVDPELTYSGPLAVLINRFSASASEIFAGAIQDYGRGLIMGEQSYGKGTVQSVIDLGQYLKLPPGAEAGQLKITLQKFYRINGSSTQHLGVMPDISFPSAYDAKEFGESANPSALPWDQIKTTKYKAVNDISPRIIEKLHREYFSRSKSDNDIKQLQSDIKQLKSSLANTSISLNEDERRKDIEEQQQKSSKAKEVNVDTETTQEDDALGGFPNRIDDVYLKQGLIILTEMVAIKI